MTYSELVSRVASASNQSPQTVREVLFALPDALVLLNQGEMVRTPLGVFRMMVRRGRLVTPPMPGARPVAIPPEGVIKLRPGSRLRKG